MAVSLVTDSTVYLPDDVDASGIHIVPVQVIVGNEAFDEGTEIKAAQVARALRDKRSVSTSRPAPARFTEMYEKLARAGATGIVSAHLSSDMSGTWESAVLAARDVDIPVSVVDTRTIGMGAGFAVLRGAAMAADGQDREAIAAAVEAKARASRTWFYVDTLEFLRRGGRIGSAQALVGSALGVKPILEVRDGRVTSFEKVRTTGRAMARMAEVAVAAIDGGSPDVAVQHVDALGRATELSERLAELAPGAKIVLGELGAVIGAHVGPGMVSVVVSPG